MEFIGEVIPGGEGGGIDGDQCLHVGLLRSDGNLADRVFRRWGWRDKKNQFRAIDAVLPEKRKKQSGFDLPEFFILLGRLPAIEALQVFQSLIDLLRRRFAPIAELCRDIRD